MAPMKAIVSWYPVARQASLAGWMMVAGGIGALAATTPLELALRFAPWRAIFVALAVTTYAAAAFIWIRIPDTPKPAQTTGLATQWAGVQGSLRACALLVDRAALRHRAWARSWRSRGCGRCRG